MHVVATVVAALAGAMLLEQLRVPAGAMVGAMVGVALVNVTPAVAAAELPEVLRFASFVALGWFIGTRIDLVALRTVRDNLPFVLLVVVGVLAAAALIAWLGTRFGALSSDTALLAAAPGGLTEMSAIAAASGANVGLVVTVHLARLASVVALAPIVARFVLRE